jgi:putative flippase GtrA
MMRLVLGAWRRYRQQILYLVVGGWNTLFQYGVFVVCWYFLHAHLHPDVILLIAYLIASINGFLGFRYIVFKPVSHPLLEYARFQMVYLPLLVINMVGLPLLLKHTSLGAYVIQALFGAFSVVVGYVGNKYFTFRRFGRPADAG